MQPWLPGWPAFPALFPRAMASWIRRTGELRSSSTDLAARFCDWVVGICDATVNNLKAIRSAPARKIVRVYNGTVPIKRAAKEDWPQKSGFTLVYVGRMQPVKNHALLLRAFRRADMHMPELRLWMVGDGSERAAMERLAAELGIGEQVTFWGQQLDVAPFFSAADAFIMSSQVGGAAGLAAASLLAGAAGHRDRCRRNGGGGEVVAGRTYRVGNRSRGDGRGDSADGMERSGASGVFGECESGVPVALQSADDGRCLYGALQGSQ